MTRNRGFTLVELLVVISIMVILTAVAAISFNKAQISGRNSRRKEDMRNVQSAAEQYYMLNKVYPINTTTAWMGLDGQMVLQQFPVDPKNSGGYVYTTSTLSTTGYCICAQLEGSNSGNSTNGSCDFAGATVNDADYFCIQNQQ